MSDLVLYTYDWVPETPRGLVRDIRVRWALEEAALPYRVAATPFEERGPEHLARHPFGQTPWLTDGQQSIFESGAILLYLGEKSPALLPTDPAARTVAVEWVFGALNSIEMATVPWSMFHFMSDTGAKMFGFFDDWVGKRMERLEPVLGGREWLAGNFPVADILMADVLRLVDRFDGLKNASACKAYMTRATARPAFVKAHADQLAWFAAADAKRGHVP